MCYCFYPTLLDQYILFQIACNKIVVDFFLSRPSDPVPCREPPDGAASDSITQVVTSDVNDETDEEEDVDVLFERYRPKDTI